MCVSTLRPETQNTIHIAAKKLTTDDQQTLTEQLDRLWLAYLDSVSPIVRESCIDKGLRLIWLPHTYVREFELLVESKRKLCQTILEEATDQHSRLDHGLATFGCRAER